METIEVPERETKRVSVTMKRIAENAGATNKDDNQEPVPRPAPEAQSSRMVPYAVGIGGGVLLITSGVFYLMRQSKINSLDTLCGNQDVCKPDAPVAQVNDEKSKLRTYNALATITGLGGLAAVGVAVGLLVLDTKASKPQAATSLYINPAAPAANLAGLSLAGAF
jgi:hypothetical protein